MNRLSNHEILEWVAAEEEAKPLAELGYSTVVQEAHVREVSWDRQLLVDTAIRLPLINETERLTDQIDRLIDERQMVIDALSGKRASKGPEAADYIAPFSIPTYNMGQRRYPYYSLSIDGQYNYLRDLIARTVNQSIAYCSGSVADALVGGEAQAYDRLPEDLFSYHCDDGKRGGIQFHGASRQELETRIRATRGFAKKRGDCLLDFFDKWLEKASEL